MLSYFCFAFVCGRKWFTTKTLYTPTNFSQSFIHSQIHTMQWPIINVFYGMFIDFMVSNTIWKFTISLCLHKLFWGVFLSCLFQLNQSKITENKQNSIKKMKIKKLYTEFVRFYRLQSYTTTTGCPFFSYYSLLRFSMDVYVCMYAYGYVRLYAWTLEWLSGIGVWLCACWDIW